MGRTSFEELALLGEQLEKTTSRLQMAEMIAQFLKQLALDEVPAGLRLLIGQVFPEGDERTLNLSWRAASKIAMDLTAASDVDRQAVYSEAVDAGEAVRLLLESFRETPPQPSALTILEVYQTFEEIAETSGKGSRATKEGLLRGLLLRATPLEAKYLVKNVVREMRHGVSEGIVLDALAQSSGAKKTVVRRANMLCGDLGKVAVVALTEGEPGLQSIHPRLFRPLKPMLAQTAKDLHEAFDYHKGEIALEYKLDGARVQIHKDGPKVQIYTRNLSQVTQSLPEIVEEVQMQVRADTAILEGEVIAVDDEGRPLPFQHVMRRFRRVHRIAETAHQVPVQLCLFDILYRDEENLVDLPNQERARILEETSGNMLVVGRKVPRDIQEGEAFAQRAYRDGHEGVMVKHLVSPYRPGVRGKAWFKVKHTISLDLVIAAADWGYGRRHGWLSNYHLAARDEEEGTLLEVGKTFKGLTDEEFREMTERLLALETHRRGGTVFVEPKVVVEVLFNEIQASSQYESGLALRFARISRVRDDKATGEADTLQTIKQLFQQQFDQKGQPQEANSG
ncbi:MAG: ATP-dependent DNA ligase [Anaerolineae bacterium]